MAKIKYDVSEAEKREGGDRPQAPTGLHTVEIMKCEHRTAKNDGSPANDLRIALNVEGDNYAWIWTYIGLGEASDWKLREFTDALGLPVRGELDPDRLVGRKLLCKVNAGSWGGEYQAKAGTLYSLESGGESAGGDDPDPDEPGGGEDDAAEASTGGSGKEYPDGYEPVRENVDGNDPYDTWSDEDVLGEAEDRGLKVTGRGAEAKRKNAIAALQADDEEAAGGGEDDNTDDYDSWDLEELVAEAKKRDISLPRGKKTEEQVIKLLREDDGSPF